MVPDSKKRWTVEEVRALPDDGNRYEVVDGELLVSWAEPLPDSVIDWQHNAVVRELFLRLNRYLAEHPLGDVRFAPAPVELGDGTVVSPDLFVVPLIGEGAPRSWEEAGRLLLSVEVPTSRTARPDRVEKRHVYQSAGIPEYWIVDFDARGVHRWRPEDDRPEPLDERLEWRPDPARPPFVLDLPAFFAQILGE